MSQIAHAVIVSPDHLTALAELAEDEDYKGFHEFLRQKGRTVEPAYGYSGSVVAVAVAYLEENGISLPLGEEDEDVEILLDSDLSPLLAASGEAAQKTLNELNRFSANEAELKAYFEDFNGQAWPEAGIAMQAALDFLKVGLSQVAGKSDWVLVFVG